MDAPQLLMYALLIAAIIGFNMLFRYYNGRARDWQEKLEQRRRERPHQQQESPEIPSREAWAEEMAGAPWGAATARNGSEDPLEVVLARRERAATRRSPGNLAESLEEPPTRPATTQRRRTQPLFRSRADLRQAVVVMTVLGPCLANAPYGRDDQLRTAPSTAQATHSR